MARARRNVATPPQQAQPPNFQTYADAAAAGELLPPEAAIAAVPVGGVLTTAAAASAVAGVLSAFDGFNRQRVPAFRTYLTTTLTRLYPDRTQEEILRFVRDEIARDREFTRNQQERLRKDLAEAMKLPADKRAERVQAILDRERRYTQMREQAALERAAARTSYLNVRDESPSGAYWMLGAASTHTPSCVGMSGHFWPWSVLDKLHPQLHAGCRCSLVGREEAIQRGFMRPDQANIDPKDALARAREIAKLEDIVMETATPDEIEAYLDSLTEATYRLPKGAEHGGEFARRGETGVPIRRMIEKVLRKLAPRPSSPAERRRDAVGEWRKIGGREVYVPEHRAWERDIGGRRFHSPPQSTSVYRREHYVAPPPVEVPPAQRERVRRTGEDLAAEWHARAYERARSGLAKQRRDAPPAEVGANPKATHNGLRDAGFYEVRREISERPVRPVTIHYGHAATGASLSVTSHRGRVTHVGWEPGKPPQKVKPLLDRPPRSEQEFMDEVFNVAHGLADENGKRAEIQRATRNDRLEDMSAQHTWQGVIELGRDTRAALAGLDAARRENRPLTFAESRRVYALYRASVHEALHAAAPIKPGVFADPNDPAARSLEEALTEELAAVEVARMLRRHGLTDVLRWVKANPTDFKVEGNYSHYRVGLSRVLDRAGVAPEEREQIIRALKFALEPEDRAYGLAALVAGSPGAHGLDNEAAHDWVQRVFDKSDRETWGRGAQALAPDVIFTPNLRPDLSGVPDEPPVMVRGKPVHPGTWVKLRGRNMPGRVQAILRRDEGPLFDVQHASDRFEHGVHPDQVVEVGGPTEGVEGIAGAVRVNGQTLRPGDQVSYSTLEGRTSARVDRIIRTENPDMAVPQRGWQIEATTGGGVPVLLDHARAPDIRKGVASDAGYSRVVTRGDAVRATPGGERGFVDPNTIAVPTDLGPVTFASGGDQVGPEYHAYYVARLADGTAVGMLSVAYLGDTASIQMIEVPEQFRRKGVASALVQRVRNEQPGVEIRTLGDVTTPEGDAFIAAGRRRSGGGPMMPGGERFDWGTGGDTLYRGVRGRDPAAAAAASRAGAMGSGDFGRGIYLSRSPDHGVGYAQAHMGDQAGRVLRARLRPGARVARPADVPESSRDPETGKLSPADWARANGYDAYDTGINYVIAVKPDAVEWDPADYSTAEVMDNVLAQRYPARRMPGGEREDYRGSHTAPAREEGMSLDNPTSAFGGDEIYGPNALHYYGSGGPAAHQDSETQAWARRSQQASRESLAAIQAARGNPDHRLLVYRAVPKGGGDRIHPGDWVTPSKTYAEIHGESNLSGYEEEPNLDWKVVSQEVRAGDLFTDGDLSEWGWQPQIEPYIPSPAWLQAELIPTEWKVEHGYGEWVPNVGFRNIPYKGVPGGMDDKDALRVLHHYFTGSTEGWTGRKKQKDEVLAQAVERWKAANPRWAEQGWVKQTPGGERSRPVRIPPGLVNEIDMIESLDSVRREEDIPDAVAGWGSQTAAATEFVREWIRARGARAKDGSITLNLSPAAREFLWKSLDNASDIWDDNAGAGYDVRRMRGYQRSARALMAKLREAEHAAFQEAAFEEILHPRGRGGRWIFKGAIREFKGRVGDSTHLTRTEHGEISTDAIAHLRGVKGEVPGDHRNKTGAEWDAFVKDVRENGVHEPVFVTVDHGAEPKISEGNHRRDAAVAAGRETVPVEVRYFGHAEQQGTVLDRARGREPESWPKEADVLVTLMRQMLTMRAHHLGDKADKMPFVGWEDFVLKHGMLFHHAPTESRLEREFHATTAKQCFTNAMHAAVDHPDLTYVEGFAYNGLLPVHHAWVVDKEGRVYDPTWENLPGREGENDIYIGVPFTTDYLVHTVMEKDSDTLMDWQGGGVSLEEEPPSGMIATGVKGIPVPQDRQGPIPEILAQLRGHKLGEGYEEALHPRGRAGKWVAKLAGMSREKFNEHNPSYDWPSHERAARFDALPDDAHVWLYHATSWKEDAARFERDGIDPEAKPMNLARERFEAGGQAEFAPGRGLSGGLYVGFDPRSVEGYGRYIVAVRVRKGDVKAPPEQEGVSPGEALMLHDGAVVHAKVPAEDVQLIGDAARGLPPGEQRIPGHPHDEFKKMSRAAQERMKREIRGTS